MDRGDDSVDGEQIVAGLFYGNRESVLTPLSRRDRNRRDRQQYEAALHLQEVCNRLGFKCYWCERPLVILRLLPKQNIIGRSAHQVTWRGKGKIKTAYYATVDHVIPIREGGSNKWDNLVPSCAPCNEARSAFPKTSPRRTKICPECGGNKPSGRNQCASCRLDLKAAWLIDLQQYFYAPGWELEGW